jgi:hypothetical protein
MEDNVDSVIGSRESTIYVGRSRKSDFAQLLSFYGVAWKTTASGGCCNTAIEALVRILETMPYRTILTKDNDRQ